MTTEKLFGVGSHGCGDLPGQDISQALAGKLAGFATVELSARRYAFGESVGQDLAAINHTVNAKRPLPRPSSDEPATARARHSVPAS